MGQPDKETSMVCRHERRRHDDNDDDNDDGDDTREVEVKKVGRGGTAMNFHVGKWSLSQLRG